MLVAEWFYHHVDNLNRSIAAVYLLLDRPKASRRAVIGLLAIHTALLAYSSYVHSPTLNEPGHLVAGLSIWKFGRFDVYNVNPPLVKVVAAIPVLAVGYEEDWRGFRVGPGARPEAVMGQDFVVANGERSFFLFMIARWACIPFSWLGGIICYFWARDLYGRPAGVIACAIWSFEPNILAHSSLLTPDAHATGLGLAACYTFWRWLKAPTWSQAAITGMVLGLAELSKTTLILFYPLWPLLWLLYRWKDRSEMAVSDWARQTAMLAMRMTIGLYILNLGYLFEGSFKHLGDFHFVSELFAGHKAETTRHGHIDDQPHVQGSKSTNRFADSWIGAIAVPFPQNYLSGIDLQQRDFEDYDHQSYLCGEWRDAGWWYYYLYAVAVKVPLGTLLLGAFSFAAILRRICLKRPIGVTRGKGTSDELRFPFNQNVALRDEFALLAPPIVIFAIVSSKTGFSEHMRYVLPCFPFAFIQIAGLSRLFLDKKGPKRVSCSSLCSVSRNGLLKLLTAGLALWAFTSSLWIYPHSLSYFNEAIGGPLKGPGHLLGSNLDWGQDARYAIWWLKSNAANEKSREDIAVGVDLVAPLPRNVFGLLLQPITANGLAPIDLQANRDKSPEYFIVGLSRLLYQMQSDNYRMTSQSDHCQAYLTWLLGGEHYSGYEAVAYSSVVIY